MAEDINALVAELRVQSLGKGGMAAHAMTLAADTLERQSQEIEKTRDTLRQAVAQIGALAREAGEAKGKLEASELAGVVDGWRERAEIVEAERDAARARIAELEKCLRECADDLTAEINERYGMPIHPAQRSKYDRDIAPVLAARKLLGEKADA